VRWSSVELVHLPRYLSVMDGRPPLSGEAPFVNESGSSVLAANLDDVSGFTARLGSRR
jgi:hypothetical protein